MAAFQHPINARLADAERLGDRRGARGLALSSRSPWRVYRNRAALPGIDAAGLCFDDALQLALATEIGLELGKGR
jgi:hypothetical protein